MALKTKVLVENITNLSEARYCAGMGVHYLVFPVESVDSKLYKDITGWVHGPEMAIDLGINSTHSSDLNEYDASTIVCSTGEMIGSELNNKKAIVRLASNEWNKNKMALAQHKNKISYLLFEEIDSEAVIEASKMFKVYVALGKNILAHILALPIEGIALKGSDEMKAGLKSYEHLSEVLEELDQES
jgi:phosphoribosylanthranilate isomerase